MSARRVYFIYDGDMMVMSFKKSLHDTHTALLCDIEPICEHPIEKVGYIVDDVKGPTHFRCECGAKVTPSAFKEVLK